LIAGRLKLGFDLEQRHGWIVRRQRDKKIARRGGPITVLHSAHGHFQRRGRPQSAFVRGARPRGD
jgi:hypothetical protein